MSEDICRRAMSNSRASEFSRISTLFFEFSSPASRQGFLGTFEHGDSKKKIKTCTTSSIRCAFASATFVNYQEYFGKSDFMIFLKKCNFRSKIAKTILKPVFNVPTLVLSESELFSDFFFEIDELFLLLSEIVDISPQFLKYQETLLTSSSGNIFRKIFLRPDLESSRLVGSEKIFRIFLPPSNPKLQAVEEKIAYPKNSKDFQIFRFLVWKKLERHSISEKNAFWTLLNWFLVKRSQLTGFRLFHWALAGFLLVLPLILTCPVEYTASDRVWYLFKCFTRKERIYKERKVIP